MVYEINYKFRHVRFRIKKNWVKIVDRIRNRNDIDKWIEKLQPDDVYISVAQYLNPSSAGAKDVKEGYRWADSCLLRGDFVLEMDTFDVGNIKAAVRILNEKGYKKLFFVRTRRGVHIWVLDFWEKRLNDEAHPFLRESYYGNLKKILADVLENAGIEFDYNTSIDTRRVVRLPNSWHSSGVFCKSYSSVSEVTAEVAPRSNTTKQNDDHKML
jgi:DNA primase catalytic subunit